MRRGFALGSISTLALGIGAATASLAFAGIVSVLGFSVSERRKGLAGPWFQ